MSKTRNGTERFSAFVGGHHTNLPHHTVSVHCTTILVQLSLLTPSGMFALLPKTDFLLSGLEGCYMSTVQTTRISNYMYKCTTP